MPTSARPSRTGAIVLPKRFPSPIAAWNGRRSIGSFIFSGPSRASARENHPHPALEDFRRARFLEPNAYQLPFEEGKAWLGWQPTLAITAWREALQRRGAKSRESTSRCWPRRNTGRQVYESLREFAVSRPGLMMKYLEAATETQFEDALQEVFRSDPNSRNLHRSKRAVFLLWAPPRSAR